jgi:hypothetical protein
MRKALRGRQVRSKAQKQTGVPHRLRIILARFFQAICLSVRPAQLAPSGFSTASIIAHAFAQHGDKMLRASRL